MNRSMVLLTAGHTNSRAAKTATGLLRFCEGECAAVLDPDNAGRKASELLTVGGDVPIVSSLDEAPDANTFVLGIATPGGKIPDTWRPWILEAIGRKMNILNGLHDFLTDDEEITAAAKDQGVLIYDVRKNDFKQIARRPGFRPECFRLHTVGHDCSVGKMLVSLSVARGMQARQRDAHFIATGQTGIMVSGAGLPIDCVAADFVSGAAEKLVLDNEHHEMLVIEGQGSLVHPAYSQVTLGLLSGCQPHALIFAFEAGRVNVGGMDHIPLIGLAEQRKLFEEMASLYQPCSTIAVAMNGRHVDAKTAIEIARKVSDELELPVCDVVRDGPDSLLDVVEDSYQSHLKAAQDR